MIQDVLSDAESRMSKAMDALRNHLLLDPDRPRLPSILLDRVQVEYYGAPTPLNQLASINVPESRLLVDSALGPGHDPGDREGDPQVGSGSQPAQRRPGDPPRDPAVDRGAAQATGQNGPQQRRGGQGRRPQHSSRRHPYPARIDLPRAKSPRTTAAGPSTRSTT